MLGKLSDEETLYQCVTMEELVPANHLLRRLRSAPNLSFVREMVASQYSAVGRASIDPEVVVRMRVLQCARPPESPCPTGPKGSRHCVAGQLDARPLRSLHVHHPTAASYPAVAGCRSPRFSGHGNGHGPDAAQRVAVLAGAVPGAGVMPRRSRGVGA
jgi:hypothetical protein